METFYILFVNLLLAYLINFYVFFIMTGDIRYMTVYMLERMMIYSHVCSMELGQCLYAFISLDC